MKKYIYALLFTMGLGGLTTSCEDVLDRITSMPVYGTLGSFSYIDLNADRIPQAIQYAEQHREEYEC